jgi:hypothetical protein
MVMVCWILMIPGPGISPMTAPVAVAVDKIKVLVDPETHLVEMVTVMVTATSMMTVTA